MKKKTETKKVTVNGIPHFHNWQFVEKIYPPFNSNPEMIGIIYEFVCECGKNKYVKQS